MDVREQLEALLVQEEDPPCSMHCKFRHAAMLVEMDEECLVAHFHLCITELAIRMTGERAGDISSELIRHATRQVLKLSLKSTVRP